MQYPDTIQFTYLEGGINHELINRLDTEANEVHNEAWIHTINYAKTNPEEFLKNERHSPLSIKFSTQALVRLAYERNFSPNPNTPQLHRRYNPSLSEIIFGRDITNGINGQNVDLAIDFEPLTPPESLLISDQMNRGEFIIGKSLFGLVKDKAFVFRRSVRIIRKGQLNNLKFSPSTSTETKIYQEYRIFGDRWANNGGSFVLAFVYNPQSSIATISLEDSYISTLMLSNHEEVPELLILASGQLNEINVMLKYENLTS